MNMTQLKVISCVC